ncbi:MAG TPA: sugar phosphate isomerase/epimerase [Bryobacteraceae bacterium]|nr:sugar phosphate isomerase/epimerase [Bryobacteraceae bacterium]
MRRIHRRGFLTAAAASTLGFGRTLKTVGVQLYTVRRVLPEKPMETLRAIEQIGYREVEATAADLDKVWAALKQTSLKAVSVHLDTGLFTRDQSKLPAALDDMKERGFQYVVCPYIAPKDRGGADMMSKLGEDLNKAGELCRARGMRLCYHNHAFEYAASGSGTLLDVLMQTADPKLVNLELDVMWAHVAGVDPVSILKQYGSRVALIHLKDVAAGVEKRYNENIPRNAFKEVGNGTVDFRAVLKAAADAGVQHYFVEQDETPGDPIESLRQSFQNIQKIDY